MVEGPTILTSERTLRDYSWACRNLDVRFADDEGCWWDDVTKLSLQARWDERVTQLIEYRPGWKKVLAALHAAITRMKRWRKR
jgi:hypothetical protein